MRQDSEQRKQQDERDLDFRPLYERLQEERAREETEMMEKLKLSTRSAVLQAGDIEYLDDVERRKREREEEIENHYQAALLEFKSAQKRQQSSSTTSADPTPLQFPSPLGTAPKMEDKRKSFGILPRRPT